MLYFGQRQMSKLSYSRLKIISHYGDRIDSIQTLESPHVESTPGSITQVRECTAELQRFSKETNIPLFIYWPHN